MNPITKVGKTRGLTLVLIILLSITAASKIEFNRVVLKGNDAPVVEVSCQNNNNNVILDFNVDGSVNGGEIAYDLKYPYSSESGILPGKSGTVVLPILAASHVRGTAYWRDYSGPMAPRESVITEDFGGPDGCPTGYQDMWSYVLDAWWIILIGFFVVMSYRFFTGRAMDFQDYFDELRGKK